MDPDVRDRAARALYLAIYGKPPNAVLNPGSTWLRAVDAVAEALAADDGSSHVCTQRIDWWRQKHAEANARVAELEVALAEIASNDQDPGYLLQRRAQLALAAAPEFELNQTDKSAGRYIARETMEPGSQTPT
jgi:hypothetical protein